MKSRVAIATLALSAVGFIGIVSHESFRSQPYRDSVGVLTDGFGNTHGVVEGKPVTVEGALKQAQRNLTQFEGAIKSCVEVPLYQHEYDAYTSLAYNIGPTAFCASTLVKKLNSGDYAGACEQIGRWVFAGGRDCRIRSNNCYGLVKRRAEEQAMCEGA